MLFVLLNLLLNAYLILRRPELSVGGASFVLPGVIPGLTVYWWLISVAVVLLVHEFSHGFLLRAQGLPTKSMGLLLFVALPGAFVEPDERRLNASPLRKRLRVFAAGPFSNVLLGLLVLLLLVLLLSPRPGVYVWGVRENGPSENLKLGTQLLSLNGHPLRTWEDYAELVENLKPGENVVLETGEGTVLLTADNVENRGSLGIWPVSPVSRSSLLLPLSVPGLMVNELLGRPVLPPYVLLHPYFYRPSVPWPLVDLLKWIFVLNLGIGMFNLLPMVPLDGGLHVQGPAGAQDVQEEGQAALQLLLPLPPPHPAREPLPLPLLKFFNREEKVERRRARRGASGPPVTGNPLHAGPKPGGGAGTSHRPVPGAEVPPRRVGGGGAPAGGSGRTSLAC